MSRQLESLTQNMQAKDQENQDKVTKLKNEVKARSEVLICIGESVCEGEEGTRGEVEG